MNAMVTTKYEMKKVHTRRHGLTHKRFVCIGNRMISSAIWNKFFQRLQKIARARRASAICSF